MESQSMKSQFDIWHFLTIDDCNFMLLGQMQWGVSVCGVGEKGGSKHYSRKKRVCWQWNQFAANLIALNHQGQAPMKFQASYAYA